MSSSSPPVCSSSPPIVGTFLYTSEGFFRDGSSLGFTISSRVDFPVVLIKTGSTTTSKTSSTRAGVKSGEHYVFTRVPMTLMCSSSHLFQLSGAPVSLVPDILTLPFRYLYGIAMTRLHQAQDECYFILLSGGACKRDKS